MKKYLLILSAMTAVGFMMPTVASASFAGCEKVSKEAAFYQGKAGGAFTAYGGCKGFEWMGGKTKGNCEKIHNYAKKMQKKANGLHHEWVKKCGE